MHLPVPHATAGSRVARLLVASIAATACLFLAVAPAHAQTSAPGAKGAEGGKFPDRPVRLIVPFAAGGGVDVAARTLAEQLAGALGVPVLVDNRPGANGTVGGRHVQTATPDGHTLLFSAATHPLARLVMANAPYDPQTDFAPVARVGEAPLMLVVASRHGDQKLADLMTSVRRQPDRWTAAIPAAGAPSHLATLLLSRQADARLTLVPYKGTQPALTDVAGGHVDMLLDSMISLLPLAKSGKVKPVAITAARRSPLAPDVPTARESGFPGMVYATWYGIWAPRETPPARIRSLHASVNGAVQEITRAGGWAALGIDPVTEDIEQFRRATAAFVAQSAELLASVGFKPE